MTTTFDLAKIMNRVQGLLAKADSTEFPEEATALRAKAEQFMRDYRIAEEDLIASDQVEIAPAAHAVWLGPSYDPTVGRAGGRAGREGQSFYEQWYSLAYAAAKHAGCEVHYRWGRNGETNEHGLYAVLVGYEGDLRMAEIIYTNARLVFGERLEPKADPSLSDQANAYRLRSAGITRDRAAKLIWGETSHARAAQVGKLYKAECDARGEQPVLDGRGINAALYRVEYAKAFVDELDRRLRAARDAADSIGGAVVLHGRPERVKEALYNEFPELRPKPKTDVAERETAPARKGRQTKPYWETAAYRREQERRHSDVAYAARGAGKKAAGEVALDRASNAQRLGEGTTGTTTPRGALEG
jgi:hypothetical protein